MVRRLAQMTADFHNRSSTIFKSSERSRFFLCKSALLTFDFFASRTNFRAEKRRILATDFTDRHGFLKDTLLLSAHFGSLTYPCSSVRIRGQHLVGRGRAKRGRARFFAVQDTGTVVQINDLTSTIRGATTHIFSASAAIRSAAVQGRSASPIWTIARFTPCNCDNGPENESQTNNGASGMRT